MPKMLSSKFQTCSIKIEDFKINLNNPFNPISTKEGVEIKNLLLGISYNMPNVFIFEFQSHSIKIEDFKINPINPLNPISTKRGSENVKLITRNVL